MSVTEAGVVLLDLKSLIACVEGICDFLKSHDNLKATMSHDPVY